MPRGRNARFTVYDVMEAKGLFDENIANSSSPRYQGPVEFPKMYYHPTGKKRIIQKAEFLQTPFGPQKVGEQFELISRIAKDENDEKRLIGAGWHDHPAKAIAASGEAAPPMTAHGRIADLERQIQVMQNQLNAARQGPVAPDPDEDDLDVEDPLKEDPKPTIVPVPPGPVVARK